MLQESVAHTKFTVVMLMNVFLIRRSDSQRVFIWCAECLKQVCNSDHAVEIRMLLP